MGTITGYFLRNFYDKIKKESENKSKKLEKNKKLIDKIFYSSSNLIAVIDKNYNIILSNWKDYENISDEIKNSKPKCYKVFQKCNETCKDCGVKKVIETKKEHKYEKKKSK
jgi:hypothetical protein